MGLIYDDDEGCRMVGVPTEGDNKNNNNNKHSDLSKASFTLRKSRYDLVFTKNSDLKSD